MCKVLLEKLTVAQLFRIFPAFHGTKKFTTVFTIFPPLVPLLNHIKRIHTLVF